MMSHWLTLENENYPSRDVARALVPAAPGLLPALVLFRHAGCNANEFRAFSEEAFSE
jgi:hypothetical protein